MRSIVLVGLMLVAGCSRARSAEPAPAAVTMAVTAGSASAKPSADDLRARLSPLAFEVTQNAATEPPFANAYWNNHAAGIYVDVVSGDPLFSSHDKFESGTGWPSFTRSIAPGAVVEHDDASHGMVRTEAIAKTSGSHLGHVFDDGPAPTGRRYCMNSAAMRFIPAERLVAEGYGRLAGEFAGTKQTATEAPAATSNACATPPPGARPHCDSDLAVAVFAALPDDASIAKPAGVLDVARGRSGTEVAIEVTYDPKRISRADLVAAWTKGRATHALAENAPFQRN